jgi:hypothetical protein
LHEEIYLITKKTTNVNNKQITLITCGVLLLCFTLLAGCPVYHVFVQKKEGEAQLAHATYSKEVAVAQAKAHMESASYEAQADTIRAHGVARSNQIIGQSLNENTNYLYWLWISELSKQQNVIYVPVSQNLPILEAGRLAKIKSAKDTVRTDE